MVPGCNPKAVHPSKKAACHYQWEADTLYLSWSPNATCKLQLSHRKVTKWSNTHSDQKDKGFECKGHIAAAFRTSAQGVFGAVGDVEEAIVRLEPVVDLSRRPLKPTESKLEMSKRLPFGSWPPISSCTPEPHQPLLGHHLPGLHGRTTPSGRKQVDHLAALDSGKDL